MAKTDSTKLQAENSKLVKEIQKLNKALEAKAETSEKKSGKFILQRTNEEGKETNAFIKFFALGEEEACFRCGIGRDKAHLFTKAEAEAFISEPEQADYKIIPA